MEIIKERKSTNTTGYSNEENKETHEIYNWTREMYEWHKKEDEYGRKIWYTDKSYIEALQKISEAITGT